MSATTGVTDRPSDETVAGSAARSAERIRGHLDRAVLPTPCLVLDLAVVRKRHAQLREALPKTWSSPTMSPRKRAPQLE